MGRQGYLPDAHWIVVDSAGVPFYFSTRHQAAEYAVRCNLTLYRQSGGRVLRIDEPEVTTRPGHRVEGTPVYQQVPDRSRTHCSSCGKPFPWYELKPGDGRCVECQP